MNVSKALMTIGLVVGISHFGYAQTNTFPASGNVGIGTTNPTYPLHIYGAESQLLTLERISGPPNLIFKSGSNVGSIYYRPNNRISIQPNGTLEPFVVKANSGYVGIGTTSPSEMLHVEGNIKIEDGSRIMFDRPNGSSVGAIGWHSETGDVFYVAGHPNHGPTAGNIVRMYGFGSDLRLGNQSNGDVLTIDGYTGKVGIGTTSPGKELTVVGTMQSKEVIVEENTGADFVFEEGYELLDLSELEEFINANKHLPEIPTAGQMKREGVKVGELQIKLLQKIEELTLYLIAQKKSYEMQKTLIADLMKRIEKLESKK